MPPPLGMELAVCSAEELKHSVRADIQAGRLHHALQAAEASYHQAENAGDRNAVGVALFLQASVLASVDGHDPEDTLAVAKTALAALAENRLALGGEGNRGGDAATHVEVLELMHSVQVRWGMLEAASDSARLAVERSREAGDNSRTVAGLSALAETRLACGSRDEAFIAGAEALKLAGDDQQAAAQCHSFLAKVHLQSDELDDAADAATRARDLCRAAGDEHGAACASVTLAKAHLAAGANVLALRAADDASGIWTRLKDKHSSVEALILVAEAKANIVEQRSERGTFAALNTVVKAAEFAMTAAKAHRAKDLECMAPALLAYARVLFQADSFQGAWQNAKAAARLYQKLGDPFSRARCLLVWAQADLALGYHVKARSTAEEAKIEFQGLKRDEWRQKAEHVEDQVDRALGLPTKAELEEHRRRQLEYQQQQFAYQQLMLADPGLAQAQPIVPFKAAEETIQELEVASRPGFKRDGASPLDLSQGLDREAVRAKISELAIQIIGEDDGLELDTPLMEAGLTSNTAVLLRDELSKDLPGIKLPPTLIFDYPSVGAMTDFILEGA